MSEIARYRETDVIGEEHWTKKGKINLFLWEKFVQGIDQASRTILFVHGSSMASQPTFDLHVKGRPFSSVMNYFAFFGCFLSWNTSFDRPRPSPQPSGKLSSVLELLRPRAPSARRAGRGATGEVARGAPG